MKNIVILGCENSHANNFLRLIADGHYPEIEVIEQGSSYKFCLLAEGLIDYYPRTTSTYEWDTAAAELILTESGGRVHSLPDYQPLRYNKENLHNPWFECHRA